MCITTPYLKIVLNRDKIFLFTSVSLKGYSAHSIQYCLDLPFDIVSSEILSGKVTIDILSNMKFIRVKL